MAGKVNKRVVSNIIDGHKTQKGDKVCVSDKNGTRTYGALIDGSDRLGGLLAGLISIGDVVGLYMASSREYIECLLGVMKSGGMAMPMDPSHPVARVGLQLGLGNPAVIITVKNHLASLGAHLSEHGGETHVLVVDLEGVSEAWGFGGVPTTIEIASLVPSPLPVLTGDESAYLLFTSGSTGTPKAIEGVHKSLSHFVHWERGEFSLGDGVRTGQLAPLTFDVSLRDIFVPLLCGGCLCIPDRATVTAPTALLAWLISEQVNLLHIVPTLFRGLTGAIEASAGKVAMLSHIFLAGEALYGADVLRWQAAAGSDAELVNLYGPSETTLAKLFHRVNQEDLSDPTAVVPLGNPISNTGVLILHNKKLCKTNKIGELYIKTPFRSKGYYGAPELTADHFVQNPLHDDFEDIVYRTGDLGRYAPDGTVRFIGRRDSQVKIRGNRVELQEVEHCLRSYQDIGELVVLALDRSLGEKVLACYYESKTMLPDSLLRDHVAEHLPSYMHPQYYIWMAELPKNLNGKIDRRSLPSPEALLYDQKAYKGPNSKEEELLAAIWGKVLQLEKVGVDHSFFELGGHSLTATRAVSAIYKDMGIQLSLKEFFQYDTVQNLAHYLKGKRETAYREIKAAPEKSHYPLSNAQRRIWVFEEMNPGMTAYNMPGAVRLKGKVDPAILEQSFQLLITKHESLRTAFVPKDGHPYQQILPVDTTKFQLEKQDLRNSSTAEVDAQKLVEKLFVSPFDLRVPPLLRVTLIQLTESEFVLAYVLHHIVGDGWSMKVLISDVIDFYKQLMAKVPPENTVLPIHYKDYAHWLEHRLQDAKMQEHREYWMTQLGDELFLPTLPFDHPKEFDKQFVGREYEFVIDSDASLNIKNLLGKEGLSAFMFFSSLLKLLLYYYSGNDKMVLGTPVAGRDHPGLENQIGLFLNYVVLKCEINRKNNFKEFVQQIKQVTLDAFEHQIYPYDLLVEELNSQANPLENPFYNVLIVMNNPELNITNADMNDLRKHFDISPFKVEKNTAKLDLSLFVTDEESFRCMIEYNSGVFEKATIEKMERDFLKIMQWSLNDDSGSIDDLMWKLHGKSKKEAANRASLISEDF